MVKRHTVEEVSGQPQVWPVGEDGRPVSMQRLGERMRPKRGRGLLRGRIIEQAELPEVPPLFHRDDAEPMPIPMPPARGKRNRS